MDIYYNKHYITIDAENRIIDGWSDGPLRDKPTDNAILLTDKGGYQFRLFPGGEENPPLYTYDAIPLYKWDDEVITRTNDEIESDRAKIPKPGGSDLINADEALSILLGGGAIV